MLSDVDPLLLKEIYDPDETDQSNSVRYVFSEQNNQDKPDGILLGNEQAVDDTVSIRDINNCLLNNQEKTPESYENVDLTMQQKNTFNELFDYVRMLEDVGGNINPVFIFDENVFVNDGPGKDVYIVKEGPNFNVKYNNITYPVTWKPGTEPTSDKYDSFKGKPFIFKESYNKNERIKSSVKLIQGEGEGEEKKELNLFNIPSNHPNMFKNFFGSSFKLLHVSEEQQEQHLLIGNKRVLVKEDVADKEYFLKKDMEVTFMPRVCDGIKMEEEVCFTISFKHNRTGKKIHRSIMVTQPKFKKNDEALIKNINDTGGMGEVEFDEKDEWGESYKKILEVGDNPVIERKEIAKNIKLMNLEFIIKKTNEEEQKKLQKEGKSFKSVGDIKTVLIVEELFENDEGVILYRYGKPYIIIKNLLDDEPTDDDEESVTFGGQIPSIKDFYTHSNMLQDIKFNINLNYTQGKEKDQVDCCNKITFEKEELLYSHIKDGEPVTFENGNTELNIIDNIKDKFKFRDIFVDPEKNSGRVIKLIDPNEGKYVPPSIDDKNKFLDLTDGKNLKPSMLFYDKLVAVEGRQKYSDSPKPIVFFDFSNMFLTGMKASNIKINTDGKPISFGGQKTIDNLIETATKEAIEQNAALGEDKLGEDTEEFAKMIDKAIESKKSEIDVLQNNISLPEYEPQKDATFQIEVYPNMLGIKMDKYILFFELADKEETVKKIKRFKEIIMQEVDNKQIRVTITQNTDGKSYVMKITGNNVKPLDSINLSSLEKIHVYQSSFIKLRTPQEQKKKRDRIKGKKDELRDAEKRKRQNKSLKQKIASTPGAMYRGAKRLGESFSRTEMDEFEEYPVETSFLHNGKDNIKLLFREKLGKGAEMTVQLKMKEIKENDIRIKFNDDGEEEFQKEGDPVIEKEILYNYSGDPVDEYTTYGLENKTITLAMYGEAPPPPPKDKDKSTDILTKEESNLWGEDDYEKPINEKGAITRMIGRAFLQAAETAALYARIAANKAGASLPSFENFGLISPDICVDGVPIIEEPVQVDWIYNEEKTKIMMAFQKMYLKEITRLHVDAEEEQEIDETDIADGKTLDDFENRKKNVKRMRTVRLCGLIIIRKIIRRLASSKPKENTEVIVTDFKEKLTEAEMNTTKYNFDVNDEFPLVEVRYNFENAGKKDGDGGDLISVNRFDNFIDSMIEKHLSSVTMQAMSPSCVKKENQNEIIQYVKDFFFKNLIGGIIKQKQTQETDGLSETSDDIFKEDVKDEHTPKVSIKKEELDQLLDFRFKISRDSVFNDNLKFKQFERDFMTEVLDCMFYNNIERTDRNNDAFGDRSTDGGIGYNELFKNVTFELIKNGLSYKFTNDNQLVSEYRKKLLDRFVKTIKKQLAQDDDVTYDDTLKQNLTVEIFSNKGLYNLILRLTCAMYFTVLHGSNFMDYDILTISQYKHVMDKLWLDKWTLSEKIKPNTLVDMLSIDSNYWEEMCDLERESFMRNRVAFFVDYIEKDTYYRDMGTDPYMNRKGIWGEKGVITAEKKEASYSTRDSKFGDSPIYSANKLQYIYRGRGNTAPATVDEDDEDENNETSISRKNIYCAEIDTAYKTVDFFKDGGDGEKEYNEKRAGYYHIYDDIIVPHLSSGMTWKYIDDEEHRVDVNEATFDKEHKTNSEVRFILYQDQINFVKYFVNLKIIPIYSYFDSFMDSFCMLASKIVDDQNYEVVQSDGDNGRSEGIYTSVDVLNYKAFYKLLESAINPNKMQELEKDRSDRMETEKQKRVAKVEKKYDDDQRKKTNQRELESLQTSAKGKFDELKVRLLADQLARVVKLPLPPPPSLILSTTTTPSGTPSVSRTSSTASTASTEEATGSVVLSRIRTGTEYEIKANKLRFDTQKEVIKYLSDNKDEINKIVDNEDYIMNGFTREYMEIVRDIAIQMRIEENMSKNADLEAMEVEHDNKWNDSFRELNGSVEKNTIPTYNDGNCLYYAIILSAWYQNKDDNDNGTRKIINDNFGEDCVKKFKDDNFELIQLKKERGESAEKDANVAPKVKEIEDRTDNCINTFKKGLIEWYNSDRVEAVGDAGMADLLEPTIESVEESKTKKMDNFAAIDLSIILARYLEINIRILVPIITNGVHSAWTEHFYASKTPVNSKTVTLVYSLGQHFDATSIQN